MSSSVSVPSTLAQTPREAVPFELGGDPPTHAMASRARWDERMGETAYAARNFRNLAYACVGAMACMVIGLVYESTQTKIRVLEVTRSLDKTEILGVAEGISLTPSDYIVAAELRRFIEETRTVYSDWTVDRKFIGEAYKMIATNSNASRYFDAYYRSQAGDPWVRVKKEQVRITGSQAIPITHDPNSKGERTWKIEWTEEVHSIKDDSVVRTQNYSATVTYFIQPHRGSDTDEQIKANPHGIMINQIAIY